MQWNVATSGIFNPAGPSTMKIASLGQARAHKPQDINSGQRRTPLRETEYCKLCGKFYKRWL
jgi:hypothetical protein